MKEQSLIVDDILRSQAKILTELIKTAEYYADTKNWSPERLPIDDAEDVAGVWCPGNRARKVLQWIKEFDRIRLERVVNAAVAFQKARQDGKEGAEEELAKLMETLSGRANGIK